MQESSVYTRTNYINEIPTYQWKKPSEKVHFFGLWDTLVREPISKTLTSSLFSGKTKALFPNTHFDSDIEENQKRLNTLRQMGNDFFLSNPDQEKIHCMHFSAESFRKYLANQLSKMKLIQEDIDNYSGHHLQHYKNKELSESDIEALLFLGILEENRRNTLTLRIPATSETEQPVFENNPTAIICGGSGVWFTVYCPMIAHLLMNGIDVMAFNYRGYEFSDGTPTETKMFQDLVSCYDYLKQEKGLKKDNLILYASSLGLGVAAKFIEKHPQTELIIDRSFADLGVVVESVLKDQEASFLVRKAARIALPLIVDFRNSSKIAKSVGHLCLVVDEDDSLIPAREGQALEASMPDCKDCVYKIIKTKGYNHDGNWLENPEYRAYFEAFLLKSGKARNIFHLKD